MLIRKPLGLGGVLGRRAGLAIADLPVSSEEDARGRESRRLPRSKIYEGSLATNEAAGEEVGAGVVDQVRRHLVGERYRTLEPLVERGIDFAEVLAALDELVRQGFYVERVGGRFRARPRRAGERPQRVADLADGIVLGKKCARTAVAVLADPGFNPQADADATTASDPEERGLVLSDPPEDLTIPLRVLPSMTGAILAKRGSGKTYLGQILASEIMAAPEPPAMVVFDPTGVWWGLLSTEGGVPSDQEIVLLGGPRGHLPISSASGGLVADVVKAVAPRAVILDLSEMAPSEQHEVCADFCERLLSLPHFPVHVVLDEADEFAPQRFGHVGGHQRRSLGLVERLVMRGRARGIGTTLISLRPAVLSKNVLSQVDALYLLRMAEPNDLRAVGTWLESFERSITSEQRSQCLGHLPVLPVGTCYYLRGGDEEEVVFRRFRVRHKTTYDSSRTASGMLAGGPVLSRPSEEVMQVVREILEGKIVG